MTVGSLHEFNDFVVDLIDEYRETYRGSLEEYLRALLGSLESHIGELPSYSRFAKLFEDGFTLAPTPYKKRWRAYDKPPANPWLVNLSAMKIAPSWFKPPTPEELEAERARTVDRDLAMTTLLFLIADLHSMTPKELGYKWRYMGTKSPRGHDWYNWDPFTFLECALSGFSSHVRQGHMVGTSETVCNWAALALILELGRVYE